MRQKSDLVRFCHKVYANRFVAATDGNLSVRLPDRTILVTRSKVCKGEVNADDIIHCDADGNARFSKVKLSTEFRMHVEIYKARPEVNAVVHCHPPHATAFASSNDSLDIPVFPEVILGIGRIPLCDYATPSTGEMTASMAPYLGYANVFLLRNHGAVSAGETLEEAYFRMEKLEHTAEILLYAKQLGGPARLSREELDRLYSIADSSYGIVPDSRNRF